MVVFIPSNGPILVVHRNDINISDMAFERPIQRNLKSTDPCSGRMLLDGFECGHDQRTNHTDTLRVPYLARQPVKHEFGVCKNSSFLTSWVTVGPDEQ